MSVEFIKQWNKQQIEDELRYLIEQLNSYTKFYDEGKSSYFR